MGEASGRSFKGRNSRTGKQHAHEKLYSKHFLRTAEEIEPRSRERDLEIKGIVMSNVYIAGPIRNKPNCNREMFDKVAKELRALGYYVFNPIEQDDLWDNHPDKPNFSIPKALAIDTDFICQQCDLMVMLPELMEAIKNAGYSVVVKDDRGRGRVYINVTNSDDWQFDRGSFEIDPSLPCFNRLINAMEHEYLYPVRQEDGHFSLRYEQSVHGQEAEVQLNADCSFKVVKILESLHHLVILCSFHSRKSRFQEMFYMPRNTGKPILYL